MLQKKTANSLGTSIAIHIFIVSGIIALIASTIQVYIEYRKDVDRVQARFDLIEKSYLPTIAASIWQFDESQTRIILSGINSLPDIAYVEIKLNDSEVFASLGNKIDSEFTANSFDILYGNKDGQQQKIGVLTVGISLVDVITRTRGLFQNILITNIFKTLLLALYVVFVLRHRITKHLLRIAQYLESNNQTHDLTLDLNKASENELAIMVKSINNKNHEIREKIQTIEVHKQELQTKVDEKTIELSRNAETKATLLRILCHDLSNPLVLITGYIELLENDRIPEEKKAAKYKTVSRAAQLMVDILSNIREMEAVESGKRAISVSPVNLEKMFDDVNLVFHNRLSEKSINLEYLHELPPGLGVMADPSSLSNHVFSNLVSNALKFSFPGSRILIHSRLENDRVHISISDTGVGMSQEVAEALFDPTRQTTRPGTKGEKGTGFGMPIVKSFLEKYGARIEVKSVSTELNPSMHGTTFNLYFQKALLDPDHIVSEQKAS